MNTANTYHDGFMAGVDAFRYLMDLLLPLVQDRTEEVDWDALIAAHAAVVHLMDMV